MTATYIALAGFYVAGLIGAWIAVKPTLQEGREELRREHTGIGLFVARAIFDTVWYGMVLLWPFFLVGIWVHKWIDV